jgi:transcription elongation factor SPT6
MQPGETPSVLALSWGKGDPQKDAIAVVFLDQYGRLRDHTKIDNLVDPELRDRFISILKRRNPDVIVLGGFTMATTKLASRVKEIIYGRPLGEDGWGGAAKAFDIPVVYMPDQVARIFQHSACASEEFGILPAVAKYCVGLARMAQNPLNEYAALGEDIVALSFDEDDQALVCHWNLFRHLSF